MNKVTFLMQSVNHNEDVAISNTNKPNNMAHPYKAKTMQVQGK